MVLHNDIVDNTSQTNNSNTGLLLTLYCLVNGGSMKAMMR